MENTEDIIADISEAREKFFGCSGKMLIPSTATVEGLLREIPRSKLITTELLGKELAKRFDVQVTCPVAARKALQTIARDSTKGVAYWRVLKPNGDLMAIFPGGTADQAALLTREDVIIDTSRKAPRVADYRTSLVSFD